MQAVERYDQAAVDRLCQAVAWAGGNEKTATALANCSVTSPINRSSTRS